MPKNISNWQFTTYNDKIYLAGTEDKALFLYHVDSKTNSISLHSNFDITETIKAFKIINVINEIDTRFEHEKVYVILYVTENGNHYLKWYQMDDRSFVYFWTWSLIRPLMSIEYFKIDDRQKLVLLYEKEKYFDQLLSMIEIYNVEINSNFPQFR